MKPKPVRSVTQAVTRWMAHLQRVCSVCRVAVHARPSHLARISGRRLINIYRRTVCHVDTYQMTVSPALSSSVHPHADRKSRPMANFAPMTEFFYSIDTKKSTALLL